MAKTIRAKLLKMKGGAVLAMCDTELIGTVLKEGKIVLDLKKYAVFYGDESFAEDSTKLTEYITEATSVNAVGKTALSVLKKSGLDVSAAKKIGDTLHIQIYRL
jgi:hypothetical protein